MKMNSNHCAVCGHLNSYGCGHSSGQRRQAKRHEQTQAHQNKTCWHYGPSVDGWTSQADLDAIDAEYPECETCGDPVDYCQGHGELG